MDLYVVLGLGREASLGDIKRAYRRLARRYHPNINPGDREAAEQFARIAEAYQTLSDPATRRRYDAGGEEPPTVTPPSVGFEGFDFSVSVTGASAPTFGDLFSEVWQARISAAAPTEAARGADLHLALTLSLEDAVRGGRWQVTATRQEACRRCQGTGVETTVERECGSCRGTGVLKAARGHMVFSRSCSSCRGSGRQIAGTWCMVCAGERRETRTESLPLDVPAGIADGVDVRVPGKGHAGWNGGAPGDLHVTVHVRPHPIFRRDGLDLHVIVPIAVHEAGLGAKIEVPTLDGPARLRIPPGTQSGQTFRLRQRGVPSPKEPRRGDLVVETRLVLPATLDERSKALLLEFSRLNPDDVRRDRSLAER